MDANESMLPEAIQPSEDLTPEALLMARIPAMAGGPKTAEAKAEYLGYRSTGFGIRQACALARVTQSTLRRWRQTDPVFAEWESNKLQELQQELGGDLVRLDFLRNMKLAIRGDFKVLLKAALHLEGLSDREFQYLKRIRSLYSPQDLLTMSRALQPQAGESIDFSELVMRITQTHAEVKVTTDAHKQPQSDPNVIDAESKEV